MTLNGEEWDRVRSLKTSDEDDVEELHRLTGSNDPRVRMRAFHLLNRDELVTRSDMDAVLADWRASLAEGAGRNPEYVVKFFLDALKKENHPRLQEVVLGLLDDFDPPYQRAAKGYLRRGR